MTRLHSRRQSRHANATLACALTAPTKWPFNRRHRPGGTGTDSGAVLSLTPRAAAAALGAGSPQQPPRRRSPQAAQGRPCDEHSCSLIFRELSETADSARNRHRAPLVDLAMPSSMNHGQRTPQSPPPHRRNPAARGLDIWRPPARRAPSRTAAVARKGTAAEAATPTRRRMAT